MYCCFEMTQMIRNAGGRGFSVLISLREGKLTFFLEMAALSAAELLQRMSAKPVPSPPAPGKPKYITLSSTPVIHYCPKCGTRLADLAATDRFHFAKLADEHRQYLRESLR